MTHESLLNELWQTTLARLGGVAAIEGSARETRAFLRPRAVRSAVDLLRLILAYRLGGMGLRSTSAWAASAGLAELSNVALLQRLRNCDIWMEHLVGQLLGAGTAPAGGGAFASSMGRQFQRLGEKPGKTTAYGVFIAPLIFQLNALASSS